MPDSYIAPGPDDAVAETAPTPQTESSVVWLADGLHYVIVWTSDNGANSDVYGRIYDATGSAIGGDILIAGGVGNQYGPQVAALSDGGFAAVWVGDTGPWPRLYGQFFSAAGIGGGEFPLSVASPTLSASEPSIAGFATGGGFVISWTEFDNDLMDARIVARTVAPPAAVGAEIPVNSMNFMDQSQSHVAVLDNGNFVVVWQDESGDGGTEPSDIRMAIFQANGTLVTAGDLLVNETTLLDESAPSVAALAGGGFVVTWTDETGDGDGFAIHARLFSSSGVALGGEFQVNSSVTGSQSDSQVAALPDGGFIVSWFDPGSGGGDVLAQRFDAAGVAIGPEFVVSSVPSDLQDEPAVAVSPIDGSMVVTWTDETTSDTVIEQRFFDLVVANTAPVANDDALDATEDTPATYLAAELTGNDTDDDDDTLVIDSVSNATGGSVMLNLDGTVTFTPSLNFNGTAGFDYVVSDGNGGTDTGHATVNVAAQNDPAVITGDSSGAVTEAGGYANGTLGIPSDSGDLNSTDVDGNADVWQAVASPAASANGYGTYTVTAAGGWTYTLDNDNAAVQARNSGSPPLTDSFTVLTEDGTPQVVTVSIAGTNDAPTVTPSGGATAFVEGANTPSVPVVIDSALVLDDVDDTTFNTANILFNGGYVAGQDSFGFTPNAGLYGDIAIVSNAGGFLQLTSASGTATVAQWQAALRSVTYLNSSDTPTEGSRYVSFNVSDGDTFNANWYSKEVTVTAVNDSAILSADVRNLTETNLAADISSSGTLTISDVDSPATYVAQGGTVGTYGTFAIDSAGAWTYTASSAHNEFVGGVTYTDTFPVSSADGTATSVTINILGTNDAAIVSADTRNLTETNLAADISSSGTLTISDVDSSATFVAQGGTVGSYGTFAIDSAGAWTYTASSAHNEFVDGVTYTDTFPVASADGTATSVTINILGTNDAAILSADTRNLTETNSAVDISSSGTLTISDVDSPATFVAQAGTAGSYGTFAIDSAGAWTYTASSAHNEFALGTVYTDAFTVSATDGTTTSVTINITGTNDAAILSADVRDLTETNSAVDISSSGTLTNSDVDSPQTFVAQAGTVGSYGTFAIDSAGAWTYTASSAHNEFVGGTGYTDAFTVAAADGTTTSVTINILGTNDAAIVSADVRNLTETNLAADISSSGTLTISDVDSSATFVAQSGTVGSYGTFAINAAGAWTYTASSAHNEFVGGVTYTDTFPVASADGTTTSVTINILGTNDAAIVSADTRNLTETNLAADISSSGTLTVSDVDSSATFVAQGGTVGSYGTFAINAAGAWTYTASSAHNEFVDGVTYTDTFPVASADGTATSVTINILGTNDAAIVSADVRNLTETNSAVDISSSGTLTISDVDSSATFAPQTDVAGTYGTFSLLSSGAWTYTASSAHNEFLAGTTYTDTFPVASADGTATSVTINILGTNDAPSGADVSRTIDEDGSYTFDRADFGFSDAPEGDDFLAVVFTTIPTGGQILLNGNPVAQNDVVPVSEIDADHLVYLPAANANGAGYGSFTFQVRDDAGTDNGGANTDPVANQFTLNVTAVNDEPTLTATGLNPVYTEDAAAADLFSTVAASTFEAGQDFVSLTLTVSNVTDGASEILNVGGTDVALTDGNIVAIGDLTATVALALGIATVTVTGTQSTAQLETLVDGLAYRNASQNPTDADRVVTLTQVVDSGLNSAPDDATTTLSIASTVDVVPVNDPPTIDNLDGDSATYTEDAMDEVLLDEGTLAMLADVDSPNFNGGTLTVSIGVGRVSSRDALYFSAVGGVDTSGGILSVGGIAIGTVSGGDYTSGEGALTVIFNTDDATIARIETALRALTYGNGSQNPIAGTRNIAITLTDGDGGAQSVTVNTTVDVVAVNDAPSGIDHTLTFVEDVTQIFTLADFSYSDIEGHALLSVTITTLPVPGTGTLYYDADGSDPGAPVPVTPGQVISAADIAAGLLSFVPATDDNGTARATFTYQVRDVGGVLNGGVDYDSSANTITIDLTAVNDAPTVTITPPGSYAVNEQAALDLKGTIAVADLDAAEDNGDIIVTLSVAYGRLDVTAGTSGADVANSGTSIVTITGTLAEIQALLGSDATSTVTYTPHTDNPPTSTILTVTVDDDGNSGISGALTATDTESIAITQINDAPSGTGNTLNVAENTPRVLNPADFAFTDPEGHGFAAVTIVTLPNQGGIYYDADGPGGSTFVPTLITAGTTFTAAQLVGARLTYRPDQDESGNNYTSFTYIVRDNGGTDHGGLDTDPTADTITINVGGFNNAPVADNLANDFVTYLEDSPAGTVWLDDGRDAIITDLDSADFDGGVFSVRIVVNKAATEDQLVLVTGTNGVTMVGNEVFVDGVSIGTVTADGVGEDRIFTLNAGANAETITRLIHNFSFVNIDTATPTEGQRLIEFRVSDGDGASMFVYTTVNVVAVDDAPTAAADSPTTDEATAIVIDVLANDEDVDGPAPSISHVNGAAVTVGTPIALPSGAILTLNANGTFSYDPNHAFDATPTPGSGASNTPAPDSFTYTLTGGGTATVSITITGLDSNDLLLGTAGTDVLFAGEGNDQLYGGTGYDVLIGGGGNDALYGGDGAANELYGGAGNDNYFVSSLGDSIVEQANEGTDAVRTALPGYTLEGRPNIENLFGLSDGGQLLIGNESDNIILAGMGDDQLYGELGRDVLVGRDGNDLLAGGTGVANELIGGRGNDVYIVSVLGDSVVELANEGTDTVRTTLADYTLEGRPDVENLTGLSNSGQLLIGNESDNVIIAGGGDDQLYGDLGRDVLAGFDGNDLLAGGTGVANEMIGGRGNDIYVVSVLGDSVVELANEGSDTVRTALAAYSLVGRPNIENLTGLSNAGQQLTGNDADNVILAGGGNDELYGGLGRDVLAGFGGNDLISGGEGIANELIGGQGDDIYFVAVQDDTIVELANEGTDTIRTALAAYTLAIRPNIENLTGLSDAGQQLIGNDADNVVTGGAGDDVILGGGGADQLFGGLGHDVLAGGAGSDLLSGGTGVANELIGGLGDDTYLVSVLGDSLVESANEGTDTVQTALAAFTLDGVANVENLIGLSGAGQALTGNVENNVITGGAGNDQLDGGLGADTLIGLGGADKFAFTSVLGGGNVDTIIGFVSGVDKIVLDDAVFDGIGRGDLPASVFRVGTTATDEDQRILYDQTTGNLYYDADGVGGSDAVLFANLAGAPVITYHDFQVI